MTDWMTGCLPAVSQGHGARKEVLCHRGSRGADRGRVLDPEHERSTGVSLGRDPVPGRRRICSGEGFAGVTDGFFLSKEATYFAFGSSAVSESLLSVHCLLMKCLLCVTLSLCAC